MRFQSVIDKVNVMRIEPEFPAHRRAVAEYAGVEHAYDQVAASAPVGRAIYYPHAGPAQPDFLIAQEGVDYTFLPAGGYGGQIGGGQQTGVQGTEPDHLRDPGAGPTEPDGGA